MPVPIIPVVIGCASILCLSSGKKRCRPPRLRDAPPRRGQECPPMPWLGDEITAAMNHLYDNGMREATALAVESLRTVYPTSPDGQALRWPTIPSDCADKRALESRVIVRAERLVAEARDLEADQVWYDGGGY